MSFATDQVPWPSIALVLILWIGIVLIAFSGGGPWRRAGWFLAVASVVLLGAGLVWTWIVDVPTS